MITVTDLIEYITARVSEKGRAWDASDDDTRQHLHLEIGVKVPMLCYVLEEIKGCAEEYADEDTAKQAARALADTALAQEKILGWYTAKQAARAKRHRQRRGRKA